MDDVLALRDRHLARSQRWYYDDPPIMKSASGVWFEDRDGRRYLDTINNVAHVGHGHPRVVDAVSHQLARLNTNSRFVYEELALYAERLTDLLPDPLDTVFFVCTGSEANDLASRIAREVTGREHVVVIDGAYHGNTTTVMGFSPNRYDGPGGHGRPTTTRAVVQPDRYRGRFGYDDPDAGVGYARDVTRTVDELVDSGTPPAAFFAESLIGTGGDIVLPAGYLAPSFAAVRDAGGLCVSDEVQVGFGRTDTWWGFQTQGVVPDIVTMGKPMGNGFPVAAVVTSAAVAAEFDNGMRYFNTFGGNPVACAAGMAVLDVLEDEDLPRRARAVAGHLFAGLRELMARHEVVGDVRHQGLYGGVELVTDRVTRAPATDVTDRVIEGLLRRGVLSHANGAGDNVLKVKPPMVFSRDDADLFVAQLDDVLTQERP